MVNYNLFKNFLETEENGYIEPGDFLDKRILELFAKSNQQKVRRLFKHCIDCSGKKYICEIVCNGCGETFNMPFSKTDLFTMFSYIRKGRPQHFYCEKCTNAQKEYERRIAEEKRKHDAEEIDSNTDEYIAKYLSPDKHWKEGIKTYQKIHCLHGYNVDKRRITDYIRQMDYYDFLETPYWKAISEKVKYKAGFRCQICNKEGALVTHHRTYEHHGDELNHMEDLICLCKECHEKYHNKNKYNKMPF